MNATILCLVRFSSSRNKLVQLLIRAWNIFSQTIRTLLGWTAPAALGLGYWTPLPRVVTWRVWRSGLRFGSQPWTWPTGHCLRGCHPCEFGNSEPELQWSADLSLLGWRTLWDSGMEPAEAAWSCLQRKEFEWGLLNKLPHVTHIPPLHLPRNMQTHHLTETLPSTSWTIM